MYDYYSAPLFSDALVAIAIKVCEDPTLNQVQDRRGIFVNTWKNRVDTKSWFLGIIMLSKNYG